MSFDIEQCRRVSRAVVESVLSQRPNEPNVAFLYRIDTMIEGLIREKRMAAEPLYALANLVKECES